MTTPLLSTTQTSPSTSPTQQKKVSTMGRNEVSLSPVGKILTSIAGPDGIIGAQIQCVVQ